MIAYKCTRTGKLYPAEVVNDWGQRGIGDGYGPVPHSFHLVTNSRGTALEHAGGQLMPVELPELTGVATINADLATMLFSKEPVW